MHHQKLFAKILENAQKSGAYALQKGSHYQTDSNHSDVIFYAFGSSCAIYASVSLDSRTFDEGTLFLGWNARESCIDLLNLYFISI